MVKALQDTREWVKLMRRTVNACSSAGASPGMYLYKVLSNRTLWKSRSGLSTPCSQMTRTVLTLLIALRSVESKFSLLFKVCLCFPSARLCD